ncbi:MAG: hypothetical protein OXB88_08690 [Bacteriovoracales bacterium]|nr:hypothetical protein [Bacteriovoracales bacterium]
MRRILAALFVFYSLYAIPFSAYGNGRCGNFLSQDKSGAGADKSLSLEEWRKLPRRAKVEKLMDDELAGRYEEFQYEEITDMTLRRLVDEMARVVVETTVTDDIEYYLDLEEHIFTVGGPRPTLIKLFKIGDIPIAITMDMFQNGGHTASGRPPEKRHYSLEEAARDRDLIVEPLNVSWRLYSSSYFEFDGREWEQLDHAVWGVAWEWTGW